MTNLTSYNEQLNVMHNKIQSLNEILSSLTKQIANNKINFLSIKDSFSNQLNMIFGDLNKVIDEVSINKHNTKTGLVTETEEESPASKKNIFHNDEIFTKK